MRRFPVGLLAGVAAVLTLSTLPPTMAAQVIGTPGPYSGWISNNWDGAMGQTFVAPAGSAALTSFSIVLDLPQGWPFAYSPMRFHTYIMAWNGTNPTGSVLYRSDLFVAPATTTGGTTYQFLPENVLPVIPGAAYVFFLSGVEEPDNAALAQPLAFWAYAGEQYAFGGGVGYGCCGGSLAGLVNNPNWYVETADYAFEAEFQPLSSTVPEPATMTLLTTGLVGLVGAGLRRRRKA